MEKVSNKLLNAIAFKLLVEQEDDPEYILEKFQKYCMTDEPAWRDGLDAENKKKLNAWAKQWFSKEQIEKLKVVQQNPWVDTRVTTSPLSTYAGFATANPPKITIDGFDELLNMLGGDSDDKK